MKPTLTDSALDHIPEFWLKTMYPDIGDRSSGEFFSSIDNITRGRGAITSYALALAVFFDSSEEALKYWYGDCDGLPSQRKVQRKFGKDYWSSSEIFGLYVKNGGSYRSIGDEIEVDPSFVGSELKAAGLPSLSMIDMRATAQAILDFQEGMSLEKACESNSASVEEVEKLLRGGVSRLANAIKEITHPKIRKNAKSPKKN